MTAPPIPCAYYQGVFRPLGRFADTAAHHYGEGEIVNLVAHEDRSEVSHRHEFAWLREAWANLPEGLADAYPSAEHLRKRALIATGWCTTQDYVCSSKAEAARWAANLRRETDEHALVIVSEAVVRVHRAKSQARGKMNKADFQASKTAILEWVAALIGVAPEQLTHARAA
jgi:hypothetical protein